MIRSLFGRRHLQPNAAPTGISVVAESTLPDGWMAGGWGGYRFHFTNTTAAPAQLRYWSAHWEARGRLVGEPWRAALHQDVPAHGTTIKDEIGFLPPEVVAQAHPDAPVMTGQFVVQHGATQIELPFRLSIPAATLPEPLALVRGEHVGLDLMASRWARFGQQERALALMDRAYTLMHDLTGQQPDHGTLLVLQESPAHPYYAYAGNPIVLNTRYVAQTLHDIEANRIPFGWVHELSHTFDVLGQWYVWNAAAGEWQANFKLSYVLDHLPDPAWTIDWRAFHNPSFPHGAGNTVVGARQFVDALFTFNGDHYLTDGQRTWDTLTSDELHSCFQRLQRVYGWELFQRWYRAYAQLAQRGFAPPATPEGKIQLCAALLSQIVEADLVPVFARWRLPVTAATVRVMTRMYALTTLR
jgi:hypothetical protein